MKDDEEEDKGDGKKEIKNENEEPAATVYTGTIDMPDIVNGEWEWGLGLDAEGRRSVVAKQGDILWKSVPGNLAKTAAWFVCEVGLSWDEIGKVRYVLVWVRWRFCSPQGLGNTSRCYVLLIHK